MIRRGLWFATRHQRNWPQLKLFGLGEGGWLKALELDEYAAPPRNKPEMLQGAMFPYLEALVAREREALVLASPRRPTGQVPRRPGDDPQEA